MLNRAGFSFCFLPSPNSFIPRYVSSFANRSFHTSSPDCPSARWRRYPAQLQGVNAINLVNPERGKPLFQYRLFSQKSKEDDETPPSHGQQKEDSIPLNNAPTSQRQKPGKPREPQPLPVQPVNIPGGPPAVFSITNNPTLDAALTTIVGLGLGTSLVIPGTRTTP